MLTTYDKDDIGRWKIYGKIAAVLLSPSHLILLYLAKQALQRWQFP